MWLELGKALGREMGRKGRFRQGSAGEDWDLPRWDQASKSEGV